MADAPLNAPTTSIPAVETSSGVAKSPVPTSATTNGNAQEAPAKPASQTNPMVSNKTAPALTSSSQQPPISERRSVQPDGTTPNLPPDQASVPSRPELVRTTSSPSTNGRLQHTLPDRPEAAISRPSHHRMSDRFGERPPRDGGRDQRFVSGSVDEYRVRVPGRDNLGPQLRSHDASHGRAQLPVSDSRPRPDQDARYGGPVRPDTQPHGELQQPNSRDKQASEQRPLPDSKHPDIAPRSTAMPPPRSNIPHHPDRASLIHGNRSLERPPLNAQTPERRSEPSRHDGYSTPDRSSRGASPARSDDRRLLRNDNRRDGRHDDRPPGTDRRTFSDTTQGLPRNDPGHPPAGPRTDRLGNSGQSGPGDRFQESMKHSTNNKPVVDLNHGRLNQDSSYNYNGQRSEQYGRLDPSSDVPSGPRMSNGNPAPPRNPRNVSAAQPQLNTRPMQSNAQNAPPPSPKMDRQTPTGPSSDRAPPRHTAPSTRQTTASTSTPPTPVSDTPDTAGIHPDRLKALVGISNATPAQIAAPQNPNSIQIQGSMGRPPPRQQPQQQQPPPVTVPRGPSNQQTPPSPTGPSPTNRGPPTGPGRSDKRFVGISGILQQANSVPNGPDRNGVALLIPTRALSRSG